MATITGTQECKMDAKGRILFPSSFKSQLEDAVADGFVLKRNVFRHCLDLYPKSEWDIEIDRINKLNRFRKKNVDFIRKFMAGVKMVELDNTGRILIARDLIQYANLKKEIVLASVVNKIEVWEKVDYEKAIDFDPDDFGDLAEEVMGDFDSES